MYLIAMLALGCYWLAIGLKNYNGKDNDAWARRMFGLSLIVLLVFSTLISLDAWLP